MKFKLSLIALFFVIAHASFGQMSPSNTKESLTLNQTKGGQGPKEQTWRPAKTSVPKGGNKTYPGLTGNGIVSREHSIVACNGFKNFITDPIKIGNLEVTRFTTLMNGFELDKCLTMYGGGWRIPTWTEMELIAANSTSHPDLHQYEPYRTLQYADVNRSYITYYQRCCFITAGFVFEPNGNTINISADTDRHFYEDLMLLILVRDAK